MSRSITLIKKLTNFIRDKYCDCNNSSCDYCDESHECPVIEAEEYLKEEGCEEDY